MFLSVARYVYWTSRGPQPATNAQAPAFVLNLLQKRKIENPKGPYITSFPGLTPQMWLPKTFIPTIFVPVAPEKCLHGHQRFTRPS